MYQLYLLMYEMLVVKTRLHGNQVNFGVLKAQRRGWPKEHEMVDVINKNHQTSIKVIDPLLAERLLNRTTAWKLFAQEYNCSSPPSSFFTFPTDSILGYPREGKFVRKYLEFEQGGQLVVLPTYGRTGRNIAVGVRNVTFNDLQFRDGEIQINLPPNEIEERVFVVKDFPRAHLTLAQRFARAAFGANYPKGYLPDAVTGIPHGERMSLSCAKGEPLARDFDRIEGPFVGPYARTICTSCQEDGRIGTFSSHGPNFEFDSILVISDSDLPKLVNHASAEAKVTLTGPILAAYGVEE